MRVTQGMTADNALYNLQQGRSRLDQLEEQISSGLNVNRPSDDPIVTKQILDLQDGMDMGTQYQSNITKSNLWLNTANTALQGMSDIVSQAKGIAGTITSGSSDQTERDSVVSQLTELKKQLVDMGNTQLGDQYIFAGFKNSSPPFSTSNNNYGGSSDDINVEINKNSQETINITGDNLLKGTGTYGSVDILDTFDKLIAAVNGNNASDIQKQAANLDSAATQIDNATSDVAAKMTRLNSVSNLISQSQNNMQNMLSNTQNVDYTKAAVELTQQQTAYQAALSATAKITQLSLLDYIS
ncbi:MAG TPA: flagellar hook-associated protein FlgL [Geobacteraceae bacterium]|nr:flagellar hook-associated protein FlgL [Geobacteraceae bacterium]